MVSIVPGASWEVHKYLLSKWGSWGQRWHLPRIFCINGIIALYKSHKDSQMRKLSCREHRANTWEAISKSVLSAFRPHALLCITYKSITRDDMSSVWHEGSSFHPAILPIQGLLFGLKRETQAEAVTCSKAPRRKSSGPGGERGNGPPCHGPTPNLLLLGPDLSFATSFVVWLCQWEH